MAKLLRSGIITSCATFASRILGLIRDIFIANLLGAGVSADVFFFANRIPNFLRRLFAEGAFSQAFIPIMAEFRANKTEGELKDFVSCSVGTLAVIVFLVTVTGMIGSAVVTAIFGWGWFMDYMNNEPDGEKFLQASFLLRITLPYLFFITLTAISGSILNTYGKFLVPAITPCLLNISMIASCLFIAPFTIDPNTALAIGVCLGGVTQFLFQIPFLYKLGMLVKPRFNWNHEGVKKIKTLMLPAIFGVSVSQLNLLINTMLASFLATGAISYLYYSDRLLEFPIGIFAVAISTVILPVLSKVNIEGDNKSYSETMDWGVKLVLILGIPAMCGMIMLREPIIRVLFLRGEFTVDNAMCSSYSLIASVSGLWSIMLSRVLIPGYNAKFDTKTPVKYGLITMSSNMIFNLILVYPLEKYYGIGYIGLALSTALASFVNVTLLLRGLHQRNIYSINKKTIKFIIKVILSGLLMSIILYLIKKQMNSSMQYWADLSFIRSCIYLFLLIGFGGMVYLVSLTVFGINLKKFKDIKGL
ncbi:MAG: murein biosynthesis integral membrane protein MurJ [Succinivibrionaceae bacterium]